MKMTSPSVLIKNYSFLLYGWVLRWHNVVDDTFVKTRIYYRIRRGRISQHIVMLRDIIKFYRYIFYDLIDERTKSYFLVDSPMLMMFILGCYVYFVTNLGPRLMKKRKAFDLKSLMIVYNIFQICVNGFLFVEACRWGWIGQYNWFCEPVDWTSNPTTTYICRLCHLYFLIKLIDLLDTIFMVLRKRDDHISFLHVYHHAGMCALAWGGVKYLPGGHGTFLGFINTFVHTIMYTYYLISIVSPQYAEKVWWKKYLTQLQMGQFLLVALHMFLLAFQPNCNYPKFVVLLLVPQNFFMFLLFCDFYRKAYCNKKTDNNVIQRNASKKNKIRVD